MDEKSETKPMGQVIQIDEVRIRDHLGEMARGTVEEALNAMLDAEADRLCGASRYERSEARKDMRAGHYDWALETKAGKVSLKVPKLRRQTFETAIIERYRRRESSVEEALIEMYLAGISVRRVEDITEALWGTRVSSSTVSNLNKKIYTKIEAWRTRPIEGEHPYVFLDGIVMKRTWAGEVRNVSLLVAIGVTAEGYREILGICEGAKEDKFGWSAFLRHLVDRGLSGSLATYCWNTVVNSQVHEHGASPRAANRNPRSRRRLKESAKDYGHYRETLAELLMASELGAVVEGDGAPGGLGQGGKAAAERGGGDLGGSYDSSLISYPQGDLTWNAISLPNMPLTSLVVTAT